MFSSSGQQKHILFLVVLEIEFKALCLSALPLELLPWQQQMHIFEILLLLVDSWTPA
jgi:hypothetical protein